MGNMCVGGRGKERGRRVKGMSQECVTFLSPAVYFCGYLLLSLTEMRSEVTAAVICYQRDEGMTHI